MTTFSDTETTIQVRTQSLRIQSAISLKPEEYKTLEQDFTLVNQAQIWRFLDNEKVVLRLLQESLPHLKKHFPNAEFHLRLQEDGESGDEKIIVDIRHNLDYRDSRARRKAFASEWFLDKLKLADRKLNFLVYP